MNQTTAHVAALARALGGYPSPALCREHLIPMRALSPTAVRCGQHVGYSPSRGLAGRTLFDGSTEGRARINGLCVAWGQSPFESGRHSKVPAMCSGYVGPLKPRSRYQARPVESVYRGERFLADPATGHFASRDTLCNSTPQRVRLFVKASRMNVALGFFDCGELA
jgi:hypothetical protein